MTKSSEDRKPTLETFNWGLREQKSGETWQSPGASCQLVVTVSKFWVQGETLPQKTRWRAIEEDSQLQPLIFTHLHTCASGYTHAHTPKHQKLNSLPSCPTWILASLFVLTGIFSNLNPSLLSVYFLWCSHFNEKFDEKYINIWHI